MLTKFCRQGDRSILVKMFRVEIMRAVDSTITHSIDSQFVLNDKLTLSVGKIVWCSRSLFTREKLNDHFT